MADYEKHFPVPSGDEIEDHVITRAEQRMRYMASGGLPDITNLAREGIWGVSPEERALRHLQDGGTLMFEPGVPGYETSPVIPLPPEARHRLIDNLKKLRPEAIADDTGV